MLIFWGIRFLDRTDKRFKDRDMYLDTATLPPALQAAVELLADLNTHSHERDWLRFRAHFMEETKTDVGEARLNAAGQIKSVSLSDSLEDECGNEMTSQEMVLILTGSPTAVAIPSGAKQHDIDYMFAEKPPVPIAEVSLSAEDLRVFGYFLRDCQELRDSTLMKEGPGVISSGGMLPGLPNSDYHHQTAVTDEEIRSFVTIFRRLYMCREPGNFQKAVDLFAHTVGDHQLGTWMKGTSEEYNARLKATPEDRPFLSGKTVTFSVKRLIDVFLYTQYAHQPDMNRERQFIECLQEVGERRNFLTWLFLREVWKCSLKIGNAGRVIAGWFNQYCDHHGITPDILNSLQSEHTGLGAAEKKEVRKDRLFREKN